MIVTSIAAVRDHLLRENASSTDLARFDAFASRRGFLGASSAALLAMFGGDVALKGLFGRGMIPVAMAEDEPAFEVAGKPGMIVHVKHPLSGEFAPHLLDDDVTPTERHYVRNNGSIPERAEAADLTDWKLTIDGEVENPLSLSFEDLKQMPSVTMPLVIECAGNGRAFFDPPVRGNPWQHGAIACSAWTGVRLRDLLQRAKLKSTAKYTAHYGEDQPLGLAEQFSRGIPIDKALEEHTLVAYAMNGKPLSALNGFPARLVVPGWVGSCSQKWLTRIWVRDREHDSQKMTGYSYRIPNTPQTPGSRPKKSEMEVITAVKVKSMITRPTAMAKTDIDKPLNVAGHAWAGDKQVSKVLVSTDYGVNWLEASLNQPPNRYAWARFERTITPQRRGYHEIWARAFDDAGDAQPFRQPWNPKGYLGNVIHRVPVVVA